MSNIKEINVVNYVPSFLQIFLLLSCSWHSQLEEETVVISYNSFKFQPKVGCGII